MGTGSCNGGNRRGVGGRRPALQLSSRCEKFGGHLLMCRIYPRIGGTGIGPATRVQRFKARGGFTAFTHPGRTAASGPSLWPRGWRRCTPTNPGGPLSQAAVAGSRWARWSTTCGAASRPVRETRTCQTRADTLQICMNKREEPGWMCSHATLTALYLRRA